MSFRHPLIRWYRQHHRDLPWRQTNDPYKIWISEVILQQTRVEQGLAYYHRFIGEFPDVSALASADEDRLMKVWQGLGYYSRARHLQEAARDILTRFGGRFPTAYEEIRTLKGVGAYTAAAVSSIAFGEPRPVIDGNVKRVMARYAAIRDPVNTVAGRDRVMAEMTRHMDRNDPGTFNQAVMELGAIICKPRLPLCDQCPVAESCLARLEGLTGHLPVTGKNIPVRDLILNYLVILSGEGDERMIWMKKRTSAGIWRNLYDFPEIAADREIDAEEIIRDDEFRRLMNGRNFSFHGDPWSIRHRLTHRALLLRFFIVSAPEYHHDDLYKISVNEVDKLPVPRPLEIFLKKCSSDRVYF